MAMRLQELHPALAHFPMALLPTALGVDALGRVTRNETLLQTGKQLMALAAGSAAVSAVAGLVAQESVNLTRKTQDLLVTHRTLNLGVIGLTVVMAKRRRERMVPSIAYLAAGVAGIAVMSYSAYLGGHMVYEHGVGVKNAGGLREEDAPELLPENAGRVVAQTATNIGRGLRQTVEHMVRGDLVPWLTRSENGSQLQPLP